jgi:hypothetical protein
MTSKFTNNGSGLNLTAPITNITLSGTTKNIGTVTGITKAMIGLPEVDNVSDKNKIISDATQTALNLKLNIDTPIFTNNLSGPKIITESLETNTLETNTLETNTLETSTLEANLVNSNTIIGKNVKIRNYIIEFKSVTTNSYNLDKTNPNITILDDVSIINLPSICDDGMVFIINNMGDNDITINSNTIKIYNILLAPNGDTSINLQKNFMYKLIYTNNSLNLGRWNLMF